ncbi:MAG TPA: ATP-binding protein, partial [Puia sp.]|nr:ATP-binding protein [Puia sp.]
ALEMLDRCCGALILSIIAIEVLKKISLFEVLLISYVLIVDSLISIYVATGPLKFILGIIARSLFSLAFLRLAVLAFRQRNFIIGIVASSSILLNVIFVIAELTAFNITGVYLFFNSFFCFIMITIYVASKYAGKSRNLLLQLDQINKLSKENLAREKEKQQMLAAQNEMLEAQVVDRTTALTHSLNELKETQSQLIQSEKMASLGELTAGIAHEIQNPLNFVNNFSEINTELIDEMNQALDQGKLADVKSVSQDIRQNQEKISHHGKRADSIVKSMLLHSRTNTGQKEATNVNALAEEYLRLSYHGLRAKDKSFNATLNTNFDEAVGELQIVPQNLGRVLLNLFNNAFYAVSEKKQKLGEGYSPTVWLSSQKLGDRIEIKVKDNGDGIPEKILDKIFQPFFTSKPVGQGTGLGLSLSYDIVTKEQRGQLKVQSEEGEYAEFVIQLPLDS